MYVANNYKYVLAKQLQTKRQVALFREFENLKKVAAAISAVFITVPSLQGLVTPVIKNLETKNLAEAIFADAIAGSSISPKS